MKKLLLISVLVALAAIKPMSTYAQDAQGEKKIIYTTLDLKQDYEIISIVQSPDDLTPAMSDPVKKSLKRAWDEFDKAAKALNADAVIGVRIELENMSGQMVGRILIYGTAVKFK